MVRSVGILNKLRYLFSSSYLNRLQRLQNKAIRFITDSKLKMSTNPQYYKLGILKLPQLYTLEIAKLMHQYSHHNLPQPFYTFFTPISSVHDRFTRAKTESKLYIPKFSAARSQKSFKYQGAKIRNSIPTEIKQLTFHKFKIEYKKKLLESYC